MHLQSRLLIVVSALLALSFTILAIFSYEREREHILDNALQQARDLRALLMATRRVYHHQFLNSGLPLNDKTLGFLPAHALSRISKDFSNWSSSGVHFNNVSDRPRNPGNAADPEELKAMRWFRAHPKGQERMVLVQEAGEAPYYQYSHPIWIEPYCLKCHGRREDAPSTIRNRYTTAFDYKVGDLRGIMSIKIPAKPMQDYLLKSWLSNLSLLGATLVATWILLNWVLRRLVFSRLEGIAAAVKRFGQGDYEAPLPLRGRDELSAVARTLRDMVIQIDRREQDLKRSRRLYHTLSETNQLILRLVKPETLYAEVCRIAVEEGGFKLAWIGVPESESLRIVTARGMIQHLAQQTLPSEGDSGGCDNLVILAYHQGRVQICNDFSTDSDARAWYLCTPHQGLSAAAALPLRVGEQTIGVFVLYSDQVDFFNEEILNLLEEMARDVAFAWDNYQREADLVHSRERVQYLAYYDPLTGLPNRALLRERLTQAINRCQQHGHIGALFHLDIDRFKQVNTSLGHEMGDHLLRQVGQDLKRALHPADTLAHIGGDEFLVLTEELSDGSGPSHQARALADRLRKALAHAYVLDGHSIHVRVSMGIVLFPNDEGDGDQLLRHAATAMHRAKAQGGDTICFFDTTMERDARSRMTLEGELREALKREQFFLAYQPQVDVKSRRLIGFEALLRWQHPDRGLVGPVHFISILEETGLILPVGAWLTNQACIQLNRWHQAGLWQEGMRLAVNLSPRQLREADCTTRLMHIAEANGVDLPWLELEVTEGMILAEEAQSTKKLKGLRSLGIGIALDDFGTGYSSLHRLSHLPMDTLKIDRSFISVLPGNARDHAMVEAIITLGKQFGLRVLAEGVETRAQRDFLLARDCSFMQGFLFGRPLTVEAAEALLRGWPESGAGLSP